jgi:flagellar biosynthetic protein FlhB
MSGASTELDRNEQATPHKLDKARRRGAVVRSSDVVFVAVLAAAAGCAEGLGRPVLARLAELLGRGLLAAQRETLDGGNALRAVGAALQAGIGLLAPIGFVLWIAAMAAAALQVRGLFTVHPLKPDFARLHPSQALGRVFSLQGLQEALRAAVRLALIGGALALWGAARLDDARRAAALAPGALARLAVETLGSLLAVLAGVFALLAVLDYALQRWQFLRRMRMSRRELREEHKEREGDPRIRARLRELRLEWLRRARSLAQVRSADVLLVNPTHVAVALAYRHGEMPAPAITARGAGELAQRMRREARRRGVPVVEHPPLARALFAARERDRFVPEACFAEVARILRWVYAARQAAGRAAA